MNNHHSQKAPHITLANVHFQTRLNAIIHAIPNFWDQRIYTHFTNHGPEHSERVLNQKIAQLAQELPIEHRLTEDEIFILSASAWLYEIGMQSPNLASTLDFFYEAGVELNPRQRLQIREHKHKLTQQLIIDSIRQDYDGPPLSLGLSRPPDDYIRAIAEVCLWCSDEPLECVPSTIPVSGIEVRSRLMVALLRLADQLYIDGSRINIHQLSAFHLPSKIEARWWAYHYTQALPIDKGKIRFYYTLPFSQKQYLGHIRALIEPPFEYSQNPNIRYLRDEYDMRLSVEQSPQVRLDHQVGFLQEIPHQILLFLRHQIEPIKSSGGVISVDPEQQERRPLLVLDYENLLLQLGLEGYFPGTEELKEMIIALTIKASDEFNDLLECWAIGHWERQDMETAKKSLEQIDQYRLVSLYDNQDNTQRLRDDFAHVLQRSSAPTHTLLVAPREEWHTIIRPLRERKQPISAWLCGPTSKSLFRLSIRTLKSLNELYSLPVATPVSHEELQALQDLCILKIEDALKQQKSIDIAAVVPLLNELRELQGHGEWWKAQLLSQRVLRCQETQQASVVTVDAIHEAVSWVRTTRSAIIKTFQSLSNEPHIVRKNVLDQLASPLASLQYQYQQERLERFYQALYTTGLLQTVDRDGRTWRLNMKNWSVVAETAEHALPLFILGIDHFLVRTGYTIMHKHIIPRHLASYVDQSSALEIYHLAEQQGILKSNPSQKKLQNSNDFMIEVSLVETHDEVRNALCNRNILLLSLYKATRSGLTAGALWNMMQTQMGRRLKLLPDAFPLWLQALQRDGLLIKEPSTQVGAPALFRLHREAPLTISLLGRLHILNLIKQMRIMGASQQSKPESEIRDQMTRFHTHNPELSDFALQYAKRLRIVETSEQTQGEKTVKYHMLNRNSPFLRTLNDRNVAVCKALTQLVERMSKQYPQGRVPTHKLLQEMELNPRFGIAHEEYRYWLSQTTHQQKLLVEHKENQRQQDPSFYSVKPTTQGQK